MTKTLFILFDSIVDSEIKSVIQEEELSFFCNLSKNSFPNDHGLKELDLSVDIEEETKQARRMFVEFVRESSAAKFKNGKDVRQYQVSGLPIYWCTSYSVKHPYNHYLFGVFLMRSLILSGKIQEGSYLIYCPSKYAFLESILKQYFNSESIIFFSKPYSKLTDYLQLLRSNVNAVLKILKQVKLKKSNGSTKTKEYYFLTNAKSSSYIHRVFDTLKTEDIVDRKNAYALDQNAWFLGDKMDDFFLTSRPGFFRCLSIALKIFGIRIKMKSSYITVNGQRFKNDFLLYELRSVLNSPEIIYGYCWMKSVFKETSKELYVFYEDEFYANGRVVSSAIVNSRNQNIKGFGVQHGMFADYHTVYQISDLELNSSVKGENNGMPIPTFFITWGSFFSSFFLSHNSIDPDRILELGNPNYIFRSDKLFHDHKGFDTHQLNVLYCLTSEKLFQQELDILLKILGENENVNLVLRFHPSFYFEIDLSLIKNARSVSISSSNSLEQDFNQAQLVITSAHSTIFIDALSINLPVIRLKTSIHDSSMDNDYRNCITISNSYKGSLVFNDLFSKSSIATEDSFLQMEKNKWLSFFKNGLN